MQFLALTLVVLSGVSYAAGASPSVTQKIVPAPPLKAAADKVPTREEMTKIMHAFREQEPLFLEFGRAFPGTKAQFEFQDRKARRVMISTSAETSDGRYVVMLFYTVRMNETLSGILEHQCVLFGAHYSPPNMTHISQVGPLIKFPAEDLAAFCRAPEEYLRKYVPIPEKKG